MSAASEIWMRVYAPGGVMAPADLRMVAATSHTLGDGTIRPGLRQDILVPGVARANVKRFRALVAPLKAAVCGGEDDPPNITSSFAAAELGPATPWADSEAFYHVIQTFDFQPGLRVQIADPLQELLPISGGDINFLASRSEDVWHVVLQLPYMQEARQLPIGVEGDCIAAFVRDVERLVVNEHEPSPQAISARLRHSWRQGLVTLEEALPSSPAGYRSYTGGYAMPKGGGLWFGIGTTGGRFAFNLVDEMGRLAMDQGVTMIGITPWNAWLVKGITVAHAPAWRALGVRHALPESPGSRDFWLADPRHAQDARCLTAMSAGLAARCPAATGLSFGIGDCRRDDVAVFIERRARPHGALWRKETFSILHREGLNRHAAKRVVYASGLSPAEVPERLAQLVASFQAEQAARRPADTPAPARSDGPVYQCPDCRSRYDARYGDPAQGVAADTRFAEVPGAWACALCGTAKAEFMEVAG